MPQSRKTLIVLWGLWPKLLHLWLSCLVTLGLQPFSKPWFCAVVDREASVSCCTEVGVPLFSDWLMIIVFREGLMDPGLVLNYVTRNDLELLMPLLPPSSLGFSCLLLSHPV